MKSDSICPKCAWLFNGHGNAHHSAMYDHFRKEHPAEFAEMMEQKEKRIKERQEARKRFGDALPHFF